MLFVLFVNGARIKTKMNKSSIALTEISAKFPNGMPDVYTLNEEQKAWLQIKIQSLGDGETPSPTMIRLRKIRCRLIHATEDIPDKELQKIVSFVFGNMDEIKESVNEHKDSV